MRRCAALVGLALLLAGCMMGPDYKRPDTPAGEAWRVAPATSESLANLPSWRENTTSWSLKWLRVGCPPGFNRIKLA